MPAAVRRGTGLGPEALQDNGLHDRGNLIQDVARPESAAVVLLQKRERHRERPGLQMYFVS